MSAKAVCEYDGKQLLDYWLPKLTMDSNMTEARQPVVQSTTLPASFLTPARMASIKFDISGIAQDPASPLSCSAQESNYFAFLKQVEQVFKQAEQDHPWLLTTPLVCKPDQLIKRRGKNGLLGINLNWTQVKEWIKSRAGKEFKLERTVGYLHTFLVEPFLPHPQESEYYICIHSLRQGDEILFTHEGGVDIGDVDMKAKKLVLPVDQVFPSDEQVCEALLQDVPDCKKSTLVEFISRLYAVYTDLQFTYLEINPLVVLQSPDADTEAQIYYLDLAAKLDQTAEYECGKKWATARKEARGRLGASIEFPAPFGRELTKEEAYISDLDAKTGASLKLTVLNPQGRIWTMVAGGGASVVYTDAIAAYGYAHEIANYGEYSGAPSESQTYEYAKTILDLMTRGPRHPEGKILFIGGGIANFTNVAATFKGIISALKDFQHVLKAHKVRIFVRRAGPNYQEGLRLIREVGESLELDMQVFGPEMFVTGIVPLALKGDEKGMSKDAIEAPTTLLSLASPTTSPTTTAATQHHMKAQMAASTVSKPTSDYTPPFNAETTSFIYGMQPRAVQGMLDFDFMCKRQQPSVSAMIYPFGGHHVQKFYWGTKEILVPVYTTIEEACRSFPDVSVVCNFASCRSVFESTMQLMKCEQFKTIAIIAEGVPEKRARQLLWEAKKRNVLIIGPATVGGIKPGCFKIGNTGGMMDNIISSKLHRPGSVAYVSKSGGMSNELNNIISRATNGVYEGVAIGGDRYPGSTFIDHLLRFEQDPEAKMMVLLGEVGGVEEYFVANAIQQGVITKPVVAWCIGTCAKMFTTDVQFGHAGSFADSDVETAEAKNKALREAGAFVPETFEDLPLVLARVYNEQVEKGIICPKPEPEAPKVPIDYSWAQELGLIRKPASFISTICDDRGQELLYAGMAISEVFKEDIGVGGVLSLLWFKRRLPPYAAKFIEMVLMLTADHGPAVSGAHNTIVTARAGKDLISSLVTGLLTIGERFGGALDGAAEMFSSAYDSGQTPQEFVDSMRKQHKLILGIGHKIKSRTNPDLRVEIIKKFVFDHFPSCDILEYALQVEKITTSKKDNLILNVDGAVGVAFVDLLRGSGAFSREEAEEYIKIGTLNGLFVLGRSIGFIGHYLDQKRLKQGLYRHPWDDISYLSPELEAGMRGDMSGTVVGKPGRTMVEGDQVVARGVQSSM